MALIFEHWAYYLLIWARLLGIVFLFPFFSWRGIPVALRLWFSLILAALLFFSLENGPLYPVESSVEVVLLLAEEVLTGLALGYLTLLFFSLFLSAGQMVDLSSGLMLSAVFDPHSGGQVTFTGQLYYLLALVFYLTLNGHHYLLRALVGSYQVIPLGSGLFAREQTGGLVRLFADLFALAFQIVAPVVIILLVVDLALGLMAKAVPQVHVFIEGLPLKIALALLIISLMIPLTALVWGDLLRSFIAGLRQFMHGW